MGKKILLLYISNASGHKSAADSIEKAIKRLSSDVEVFGINFFGYVAPVTEKIVNTMYMGVIKRAPIIWQVLYDNPRVVRSTNRIRKFVYKQIKSKVDALMSKINPDVVIATQAFPCEIVAKYKRENSLNFKLFAVLTDFYPHSFWISDEVDCYVVATELAKCRLERRGADRERIRVMGIPIDPKFCLPCNNSAVAKKYGFDLNKKRVMIMGGGQGLAPFSKVVKQIDKIDKDFEIIVVCGKNKRQYNSVEKIKDKINHKLYNFGYVEGIDELMSVSTVLITKPGGLTVSEAMSKGLPMVIINSLPGQEYNNLKFLVRNKCCLKADKPIDVKELVEKFLSDEELWFAMHRRLLIMGRPNAAIEIAHLALEI